MYKKWSLDLHRRLGGKLEVRSKVKVGRNNLAYLYTPGVAEVSRAIVKNKKKVYDYTSKKNTVAVVTDGSAVLGMGNIGAEAALPVMEGKAVLFKEFAGVDAFPICLKTQDVDEIVSIVRNISPVFGGINLEDISAPRCFEIEDKLQNLGIPVMHDDQHGTAIVVLAGLINACKVVGKKFSELKVVVNGAGAAGSAIVKLLTCHEYQGKICESVEEVIVLDSKGAIYTGRSKLNGYKKKLASISNRNRVKGDLKEVIDCADVFIGVSHGGVLKKEMVRKMARGAIVFAMANPDPEIMPIDAFSAGASVVATGRSDFPNQVNNVLVFPGIFRGALDSKVERITAEMKLHSAHALASCVGKPTARKILPDVFDKSVVKRVANAVKKSC